MKNKNDSYLSSGMCQAILDDSADILRQLEGREDDDLPVWWISKLAVASAYLNSLRDYITYNASTMVEEEDEGLEEVVTEEPAQIDNLTDLEDSMLPPSARMMKNAVKEG